MQTKEGCRWDDVDLVEILGDLFKYFEKKVFLIFGWLIARIPS